MGRPSFRGDILRDHGTERPEGLPTMGTAPKTQESTKILTHESMTLKGLFRRLAHPLAKKHKAGQQDRQDVAYTIPYNIASKERIIADTHRTPKLAKGGFQGRHGEAVGHRPLLFSIGNRCDFWGPRWASQSQIRKIAAISVR